MKQIHIPLPSAIRGLTLVEIMIALVLAMLVSAGAIQVFISNKVTYQSSEALSRIQENGRFSIEFLTKEIRMAGFVGCQVTSIGNSVNDTTGNWKYDFNNSIIGFEGGASTFPSEISGSVISGSDAIIISRGDQSDYYVDNHVATSATIHLTSTHNLKKGEVLMIADCLNGQAGIFQQTNTNNNNTISNVGHNTGAGVSPGNCTNKLKGNFDCSNIATAVSADYDHEAQILRMKNSIFYIAPGRKNSLGAAIPSLYHSYVSTDGVTVLSEELVEGIENFQIVYGVDTDATADGVANRYITADSVADWTKIASVRLFLLARSIEPTSGGVKPYTFMGTTSTSHTDRYIRRQFTATIQVRNHGLGL
ncbi:MAG: hypothetical protein GY942_19495 [Aestuariibacter sp.]|nr:hypothetical protein [Aestuariibacter sp.]